MKLITGDALEELEKLPSASVDCVVTSPPYWGQRDYGVQKQLGLETSPEEYADFDLAKTKDMEDDKN